MRNEVAGSAAISPPKFLFSIMVYYGLITSNIRQSQIMNNINKLSLKILIKISLTIALSHICPVLSLYCFLRVLIATV